MQERFQRNTPQHTATHCNTLQHTATPCNTLQLTATHCNTLQHTATHCNTLQHIATHCRLQDYYEDGRGRVCRSDLSAHTIRLFNVTPTAGRGGRALPLPPRLRSPSSLAHIPTWSSLAMKRPPAILVPVSVLVYCVLQCVAGCCSVLQCVAVCCSVLQCVAVCCSVLQCVAVCCSVLQCVAVCCSLSDESACD